MNEKRMINAKSMKTKVPPLIVTALLALVCYCGWTGCTKTYSTATDHSQSQVQTSQSLVDYLKNNYAFSIFYAGLLKAGLDTQIAGDKKFTLLIPDNDAFARAGITLDSVLSLDGPTLHNWLGFHIVRGAIGYDSVPQTVDNAYFSILGQKIFFSRPVPSLGNSLAGVHTLHINGTAVNNFDIRASNGFIQVLNMPLDAPLQGTIQDYLNARPGQFSRFKAALLHFNLWDQLKDTTGLMTVYAPVNACFDSIPIFYKNKYDTITIDDSVIAHWDTTVIPKAVFAVYILPSRIFTSDYTDDPATGGSSGLYAGYIFPDKSAAVNFPYGSLGISAQLLTPYQYRLRGGNAGNIINPGNFTITNGNNVLQPIDHILLIP